MVRTSSAYCHNKYFIKRPSLRQVRSLPSCGEEQSWVRDTQGGGQQGSEIHQLLGVPELQNSLSTVRYLSIYILAIIYLIKFRETSIIVACVKLACTSFYLFLPLSWQYHLRSRFYENQYHLKFPSRAGCKCIMRNKPPYHEWKSQAQCLLSSRELFCGPISSVA